MLMSMTGQGQGTTRRSAAQVSAEVRSVNNRHLKIHLRTSDPLNALEPQIENLVRNRVRRGSLQLNVQLAGAGGADNYSLQPEVIERYARQCEQLASNLGWPPPSLGDLLALPGAVVDRGMAVRGDGLSAELTEAALAAVEGAIEAMNAMRAVEGDNMRLEMLRQLEAMKGHAAAIEQRAPGVVDDYRERLTSKLKRALAEIEQSVQPADMVREVLLFAERADIREEIVRLGSHIGQFERLLAADESQGRKLDFLTQEMFRESNTMGAKANDATVASHVVELKSIIEQLRELVQNVE